MAGVIRNGRPNRPIELKGARTGLVALLALSAGAGCGQAMVRPKSGPGLAVQALGQVDEEVPGRQLGWEDPGQAAARAALVAKGGGSAKTGLPPGGPISIDSMTAGPHPSPTLAKIATFDGSSYAKTTWNGWKIPDRKPFGAAGEPVQMANRGELIEMPRPINRRASARLMDDSLLEACRESKIAPPTRRKAGSNTPAPVVDSLAAACREARIAPPKAKAVASNPEPAVAAVVARAPVAPEPVKVSPKVIIVPPTEPVADAVELPRAATQARIVDVPAATKPEAVEPRVQPTPMPLLVATPTEVPPIPTDLPTNVASAEPKEPEPIQGPEKKATETLESESALADRRPVRLPKKSPQAESTAPEAPMDRQTVAVEALATPAGPAAPPPPLDEALRVTDIEPPRRPEPNTPEEASLLTDIALPHRPPTGNSGAPNGPVATAPPTPEEASKVTQIELPHPVQGAEPTPEEAARVTRIELPHRPEAPAASVEPAQADPVEPDQAAMVEPVPAEASAERAPAPEATPEEASRATEIELPHRPEAPAAVEPEASVEPTLEEASRVSEIELPHRPTGPVESQVVEQAQAALAETANTEESVESAEPPPPIPNRLPD